MLCLAGNFVSEETTSSIINLIVGTSELFLYSVHRLYHALNNNLGQEALAKVAIYVIGEFGDLLISNSVQGPDGESISVSESDVMDILSKVFYKKYSNPGIKEYLLNCFLKLSVKFRNSTQQINDYINEDCKSAYCEVQQRANEYIVLCNKDNTTKSLIVKNTPLSTIVKEQEIKKYLVFIKIGK
jgi:AP-1 complex subunit gamma-1